MLGFSSRKSNEIQNLRTLQGIDHGIQCSARQIPVERCQMAHFFWNLWRNERPGKLQLIEKYHFFQCRVGTSFRVALRLWQYSVPIACGSKNVYFLLPQVIFFTAASDCCFLRGRGSILKAQSLVAVNTRCSLNRLWRYSVVPDARLCICVYVSMYLSMYFSMDLTSIYLSYLILSNLI